MAQTPDFNGFVPGLEFFQTFLKGAGMPSQFASWVAPTMDVDEIERKITDLRAVLNWLEANSRMTQNLIQALEVQRMTLTALRTMNVDMQAFAKGFAGEAPAATPEPTTDAGAAEPAPPGSAPDGPGGVEGAGKPLLDPMQWWTAMTQQFAGIATQALQEGGAALSAAARSSTAPPPASTPGAGSPEAAAPPKRSRAAKPASAAGRAKAAKPRG